MHIRSVAIAGYRSVRAIRFPVGGLTVFVGANGVGKTNLYRALQLIQRTLVHIREDTHDLDRMIDDAFPGARLDVPPPGRTASFGLILPDYPKRVFAFVALNVPEASLHPELLEPLARLVIRAAERTQIWVVTHSEKLANGFAELGDVEPREVIKRNGETWIEGLGLDGDFETADDEALGA
ncbi:MAG: AAA family ATPase [Xanthobacteraceae bacterium]